MQIVAHTPTPSQQKPGEIKSSSAGRRAGRILKGGEKTMLCWYLLLTAYIFLFFAVEYFHHLPIGVLNACGIGPAALGLVVLLLSFEKLDKKGWAAQIRGQTRNQEKEKADDLRKVLRFSRILKVLVGVMERLYSTGQRQIGSAALATPGGRSLPSLTLTPRLLAQRPFIHPRARAGAF